MLKTLLGFDFDDKAKTMWLEAAKREKLLTVLKSWVRTGKQGTAGIPFKEYESVVLKLCHAFIFIPEGVGLLFPCNRVLQGHDRHTFILIETKRYSMHGRDVAHSLENQHGNLRDAES